MVHHAQVTSADPSPLPPASVPAEAYDDHYYRATCGGFEEWTSSEGRQGAPIYAVVLDRAGFRAGQVLLDVGTGRGEMLAVAADRGARLALGVEYAAAAVTLTQETLRARAVDGRAHVLLADARRLPLPAASVDMVTMLDVIEHLTPTELDLALREVCRVLRPGGILVGHTFPTRTIYDLTYRCLRLALPRWRRSWPVDPRVDEERRKHVNEQTVRGLRRSVTRAGFPDADVHLGEMVYTAFLPSISARRLYERLAQHRLTRPLAVADMWVYARRPGQPLAPRAAGGAATAVMGRQ